MRTDLRKLAALAVTLGVVVSLYALVVRPWFLSWGSTESERTRALPGDEIAPGSRPTTRAVTISAPADEVWPWVAQLGQDRAGFYSYEILEDLAGCEMPRATRILPGAQEWRPGDSLWMYPPEKLDGLGGAPLLAMVPGRALAFATWRAATPHDRPPDGSWAFVVEPAGADTTRLLVRSRATAPPSAFGRAFDRGFFEAAHFVMERRMMEGIRGLAEGRPAPSRAAETAEVLIWAGMAAVFVWGIIAVFRWKRWAVPLAVTGAAAIGFQVLTLAQPPVLAAGVLLALLTGSLLRAAPLRCHASAGTRQPSWTVLESGCSPGMADGPATCAAARFWARRSRAASSLRSRSAQICSARPASQSLGVM